MIILSHGPRKLQSIAASIENWKYLNNELDSIMTETPIYAPSSHTSSLHPAGPRRDVATVSCTAYFHILDSARECELEVGVDICW